MAHKYNSEYSMKEMKDKGVSERDAVLTDMKQSKEDMEEKMESKPMDYDMYPYGLELELNTESLEKLGVKEMKDVGDYCMVTAVAKVKRVSESSSEHGDDTRSMCLQVQKMSIEDYDEDM